MKGILTQSIVVVISAVVDAGILPVPVIDTNAVSVPVVVPTQNIIY